MYIHHPSITSPPWALLFLGILILILIDWFDQFHHFPQSGAPCFKTKNCAETTLSPPPIRHVFSSVLEKTSLRSMYWFPTDTFGNISSFLFLSTPSWRRILSDLTSIDFYGRLWNISGFIFSTPSWRRISSDLRSVWFPRTPLETFRVFLFQPCLGEEFFPTLYVLISTDAFGNISGFLLSTPSWRRNKSRCCFNTFVIFSKVMCVTSNYLGTNLFMCALSGP